MTLVDRLLRTAELEPTRIAIDAHDVQLSYGRLAYSARAIANGLAAHGVHEGASIGVLLPSGGAFLQCCYGAWMNGNIVTVFRDASQLTRLLSPVDCNPFAVLVVSERVLAELETTLRRLARPPRVFVIGAPGKHQPFDRLLEVAPTGVARSPAGRDFMLGQLLEHGVATLTSDNLVAQVDVCRELLAVTRRDRWLNAMPVGDPFALLMTLTCVDAGATVVVRGDDLDGAALVSRLRDERITLLTGSCTLLRRLVEPLVGGGLPALPKLRRCVEVGHSLNPDFASVLERALAVPFYRSYFVLEAGLVSCGRLSVRQPQSVGIPHRSFLVRIEDDGGQPLGRDQTGRILLRSPAVAIGTASAASALGTRFPGWLATSDVGCRALDGSLHATASPTAFVTLVRKYMPFVLGLLRRSGVPRYDVEDVAIEVFLAVRAELPSFDGSASHRTWLCGVCRHYARAYVRRICVTKRVTRLPSD